MIRLAQLICMVSLAAGCTGDVDAPWQLDHDRIIAVRATPPRILVDTRAEVDALIGRKGAAPAQAVPTMVTVISPPSLADTLAYADGRWIVTAPSADRLAAVRSELGLPTDAPVPLTILVTFADSAFPSGDVVRELAATKTVWLGEAADNPVLHVATVDGVAAPARELVVGHGVDIRLSVEFPETDSVNWLSSCGSMHDYDLPQAYLRVEPADPAVGDLAVVVRTQGGGVVWQLWSIRAE